MLNKTNCNSESKSNINVELSHYYKGVKMGKKDKKKEKMSDALAEGVVELILTIIVGGLGFIICLGVSKLFSFKIDELDLDTFILIGIVGLVVIVLVGVGILQDF